MKILVPVNGKERSCKATPPTVGKWFIIMPANINLDAIKKACKDAGENNLWKNIEWAKRQMSTNLKYKGKIETLVPEKTWEWKTEEQLREMAGELGDEMTDEVVQYLKFAQRIDNGEKVEILTETKDSIPYYRIIVTRTNGTGFVGGVSTYDHHRSCPPAVVRRYDYLPLSKIYYGVPSVARFSE